MRDEGDMMFSDEIVVKDRVGVRFSEEGVGSMGGRRDRKAAISDNKFQRIDRGSPHHHLTSYRLPLALWVKRDRGTEKFHRH